LHRHKREKYQNLQRNKREKYQSLHRHNREKYQSLHRHNREKYQSLHRHNREKYQNLQRNKREKYQNLHRHNREKYQKCKKKKQIHAWNHQVLYEPFTQQHSSAQTKYARMSDKAGTPTIYIQEGPIRIPVVTPTDLTASFHEFPRLPPGNHVIIQ
jgi:hypothetical protein